MLKQSSFALLLAAFILAGCSQVAPASAQSQTKTAQSLVNSITGNARGSRDAARALRAESDQLLAARDYKGAMDKRLEIFGGGAKNSSALGALTSYATQSLALGDLAPIVLHLDGAACLKYADQLAAIDAQLPSYSSILQRQEASELKDIALYTRNPQNWKTTIAALDFTPQERQTLYNTSVTQLKANISSIYNAEAKWSTQPYSTKTAPLPSSIDPYTKTFAVPSISGRFLWTQRKTERLLAIVALQQRADRLGKQKRTWALPADPFGNGPLKEKNGTIYSVGPDTKDDGGKSVPIPSRAGILDLGDIPAPTF